MKSNRGGLKSWQKINFCNSKWLKLQSLKPNSFANKELKMRRRSSRDFKIWERKKKRNYRKSKKALKKKKDKERYFWKGKDRLKKLEEIMRNRFAWLNYNNNNCNFKDSNFYMEDFSKEAWKAKNLLHK